MSLISENVFATGDGARIWTARGGEGPDVALAHGGPGLWDYLELFAHELEPFARIHRWDQRGCGRSEGRGPYTVARFIADMDDVRAAAGVERWVAGGHSWGASLALAYALAQPERVSGVLYISGVGLEWPQWVAGFRAEQLRRLTALGVRDLALLPKRESNRMRWTSDFGRPQAAHRQVQHMLQAGFSMNSQVNRQVDEDFRTLVPQLSRGLPQLDKPVLIIQGTRDPRPYQAVDSLVTALPPTRVRRVLIEGAGHFPWAEQPDLVRGEIEAWLREIES